MTPEQEHTFLDLVRMGMYPSEAARKVGVTPQAISMRKKRSPDFLAALERAEAGCEGGRIAIIINSKDPRIALEFLARRFPARWARPEVRAELNVSTVSSDAIVNGIEKLLKGLAARHAPPDAVDVDGDQPAEDGAGGADQPVTRS